VSRAWFYGSWLLLALILAAAFLPDCDAVRCFTG
jgi:hypothetical protein